MPVILSDTFDRADTATGLGTADTGQPWDPKSSWYFTGGIGAAHTGGPDNPLGIASNQCYSAEPQDPSAYFRAEAVDLASPDVSLSLDIPVRPAPSEEGGLLLRWADAENFATVALFRSAGGTFYLYGRIYDPAEPGNYVDLATVEVEDATFTGTFAISGTVIGDEWEVSATPSGGGATQTIQFTDSRLAAATSHGVYLVPNNLNALQMRLDNLYYATQDEDSGWRVGSIGFGT